MANADQHDATPAQSEVITPNLTFSSITFSDGTTISLDDDDIVVLVGPNNAGKSVTLSELESRVAHNQSGRVLSHAEFRKIGDGESLKAYLDKTSRKTGVGHSTTYSGLGYSIQENNLHFFSNDRDLHPVAQFFVKRLSTEQRLEQSNPAGSIALYRDPAVHPIHVLLMNRPLASDLSDKFRHAFGKELIPFKAGGSQYPLLVGQKPAVPAGETELDETFVDALLETCEYLHVQGDGMRSFATVLLHVVAARTHSILLLDEPEAFLHPPQARLLGKYISQSRRKGSQLFVATHSSDVLEGLLEDGASKVRIIRLQRDGVVNRAKELNKDETRRIASDPLTRLSRILEGVFYQHVVICEADSDCLFYQSILNLAVISGERRPDVLFVHGGGKDRIANMAKTLGALSVPASVIVDIDILSVEEAVRRLVEAMAGDWSTIYPHWKVVSDEVKKLRPPLSAGQVANLIAEEIKGVSGNDPFPSAKEKAIKGVFQKTSSWSQIKHSGRRAIPVGETTRHFDELIRKLSGIGIWVVPEGELEGFCRSVGGHGPKFVEDVLTKRNLETDSELQEARDFMKAIWQRASEKP